MLRLEDLEVDAQVVGVDPAGPSKVLHVSREGLDAVTVTYKTPNNAVLQRLLFRDDEAKLGLVSASRQWTFAGDANAFKLAAEAMRLKLAYLFDPMMAVHTSDVEPLPHQVAAVYEAMLPRQPLRFVLADDPGAGKTVMAGLLIRELMLRGDLERCLIVAPGSLVEQWQAELTHKFGLQFTLLSNELADSTMSGNPFTEHPRLIARLDQLSRNELWHEKLKAEAAHWDLVVVDEAHKLAAHYAGTELRTTKRYELGKLLGNPERTRNFLLMTATPHNGHEEDFQAWLALLDEDRFMGKARDKAEPKDVSDIMRRMVKEDLVKFDGKKLFPERRAQTVNYTLSHGERQLYDSVTDYVRNEMGRADALDGKKKGMVGFALTILQRRLASSPNAIAQSLRRRREKLMDRLDGLKNPNAHLKSDAFYDLDMLDDDYTAEELEKIEEQLVDDATAAKTIPELQAEIEILRGLERDAQDVVKSGVDKKWDELSKILASNDPAFFRPDGKRRKMIIFTEHKDTLDYLRKKIAATLGNPQAVIEIHGGTRRDQRLEAQEQFRQNSDVVVLVATDAAGEGMNLQVANLMVNYDLPWNPNRIEQRFGRIHRIGQPEVCHLWNLVAAETREGEVFQRLFAKLEEERKALGGKVFDILGQSFEDRPLRDLLLEAIRYGDQPDVREQLFKKVEVALDHERLQTIIERNALTADVFSQERLYMVKEAMEKAEAKKLQPFFLRRFLVEAFDGYGGQLHERETGRYEIRHVPAVVRRRHVVEGGRKPVLEKYDRITFDRHLMRVENKPQADLVHPAHPLMSALLELVSDDNKATLYSGTVLVDPADPTTTPRLMFMLDHGVREGQGTRIVSRRMQFVEMDQHAVARSGGSAPYLSYRALNQTEQQLAQEVLKEPWLAQDVSGLALSWASENLVREHFTEVQTRTSAMVKKTLAAVHERLTREINHWSARAHELSVEVKAGRQPRMQPDNARKRAEELKARLAYREKELEAQLQLANNPPSIAGCALILPQGLIDLRQHNKRAPEQDADLRRQVENIAMQAVFKAEAALGHHTKDVSALKCGWDITSTTADGTTRHIEVKGRHKDASTVTVTANEILEGLNQGDKFILAIVQVAGPEVLGPFYVRAPFTQEPESGAVSINYAVADLLARAKSPAQA